MRSFRATTVMTSAAFLVFAAIASGASAGRDGPRLRVMSYNIQYGHEGLDSVIATINSEKPDIVGLQEVDVHWLPRSAFVDQAKLIAQGTGMHYRYAPIYRAPNADSTAPMREFGVALLSRYPISSFTNHEIARLSTQERNPVPAPLPGLLEAVVDVEGTRVRVFNVHLDFRRDPAVRRMQVADMLAVIGQTDTPTLLLGDLNARPEAPELEPLFGRFLDTWSYAEGPGLTGPARNPAGKIDFVLASEHFTATRSWVPQVYSSDHFPVVADLVLNKDRSARSKRD